MNSFSLIAVELLDEQDVVQTRQRARQVATLLGLSTHEATSFATAASEIARNAIAYAGGGRAEFFVELAPAAMVGVRIKDRGPGIGGLAAALEGRAAASSATTPLADRFTPADFTAAAGSHLGLISSRKLSDFFDIQTTPGGGTTVTVGKRLPRRSPPPAPQRIAEVVAQLAQTSSSSPLAELQHQNRELLLAMAELQARQAEVERLNAELSETNRGVLALYAELDRQADTLRSASGHKSRFLSDMSHELRTPLNAMISITGLLLDRTDGDLTEEQEKQVWHIRNSAESLREMVNDLLDLAKIESGKLDLRLAEFPLADVLAALRGMFRPLLSSPSITFVADEVLPSIVLYSDEQKLSQILRNLVANALKFTERGQVRVRPEISADGQQLTISVIDTGIGISPEDQERIFNDYTQIDSPTQRRLRGTGLGLPLTRKLARALGGEVSVHSTPGAGSTFAVTIPMRIPAVAGAATSDSFFPDVSTAKAVLAPQKEHG